MSEQNVEFVKGVYGAFARGDIPTVLGAFADDVEWFEAEGMPYGGLYRSGEAVLQNVFGPIAEDVEGFAVTPEEYIGSGATVAAIVRYTGTGKATGKRWTSRQSTSGRSATASWRASGSSSTRSSSRRSCPRPELQTVDHPTAIASRSSGRASAGPSPRLWGPAAAEPHAHE